MLARNDLHLFNLYPLVTQENIIDLLVGCGTVVKVELICDKHDLFVRRARVEFSTRDGLKNALEKKPQFEDGDLVFYSDQPLRASNVKLSGKSCSDIIVKGFKTGGIHQDKIWIVEAVKNHFLGVGDFESVTHSRSNGWVTIVFKHKKSCRYAKRLNGTTIYDPLGKKEFNIQVTRKRNLKIRGKARKLST